jgi:UDP-N-acetylglucosamine transferase subunit ALG13
LHQNVIKKFTECWIPDYLGEPNLSGKLSHTNNFNSIPLKYIGPQSRFTKHQSEQAYDIMVLLSGPEPQRTYLEKKLLDELKNYKGNIVFIKGIVETIQKKTQIKNMIIYNYMTSPQLEKTLNESKLVLSRSGYTTIMDLAKLEKRAFFIPTHRQFEQEYLAGKLETDGLVPFCKQEDFTIDQLEKVTHYKGFKDFENDVNYKKLFSLFERE